MALGLLLAVSHYSYSTNASGYVKLNTQKIIRNNCLISWGVKNLEYTNKIFICLAIALKCRACNSGLLPGCGDPFIGSKIDGAHFGGLQWL